MNKKLKRIIKDSLVTALILLMCLFMCFAIHWFDDANSLIPSIFVLGAFLTSVVTDGYVFGIFAALASVLAVNFAFTFPFFAFDFTIPENIISAGILLVITMITCSLTTKIKHQEAIKAESEKERMRANLLRAISHDLRTPLTTIYGSSSALLDNYGEFSDEQNIKMLSGIKQDADWLSRMVENLLSITRLDSGDMKIIKSETVLDELIDSILVKFAKRYPDVDVEVDIPAEFVTISMDALLIEQVAINILDNAVQHAEGMTELSFKVFTDGGKAVFEISDNGCGISKERLKNLFTGVFPAESSPPDGTKNNAGIGLSVCSSIIRAHGGEISAENLKRGGCLFRFTLDMEDCDNAN